MDSCPVIKTRTFAIGQEPKKYCGPEYHKKAGADSSRGDSGSSSQPLSPDDGVRVPTLVGPFVSSAEVPVLKSVL